MMSNLEDEDSLHRQGLRLCGEFKVILRCCTSVHKLSEATAKE